MRKGVIVIFSALVLSAFAGGASAAQAPTLLDAVRALSPGGNTVAGPGIFVFQPNQSVNVVDLSTANMNLCASILVVSGKADINVKDSGGATLQGSVANATPGVGGIFAGATACADAVGLVEVKCNSTSTEVCQGAWRADKK